MTLDFQGRVVIVTGAGNGLGRAYALDFAKRGARVVVNDLGGSTKGEGKDTSAADKVVAEIKAAGGTAVANYDSVVDGAKIVKTAIDAFGTVDVVVNNAGILRDVTFHKMTDKDWNLLYEVHLKGAYAVTKAAWPYMRDKKYGRVIMVTSAAGLYGNFGQTHYSTVKMGLLGFANALAKEGAKLNVHVNTIAPLAGSRMTETIMPPEMVQALKPEYVSPLVLYLCHDKCAETGSLFEVGAGWVAKVRWERSQGAFFPLDERFTIESVQEKMGTINDFASPVYPTSSQDSFASIMQNLDKAKAAPAAPAAPAAAPAKGKKAESKSKVDVAKAMAHKFEPALFSYKEKDLILYALGVGAAENPWDLKELNFVYEGASNFQALPTFGVIIAGNVLGGVMGIPGLEFNPMMLLHGEQYMELKTPLPTAATLTNHGRISAIYDKGSGAVVMLDVTSKDEKGQDVLFNQYSLFIRGIGGFGGDKGPKPISYDPPQTAPHVVHREVTHDNQAVLYRLSGDLNPLHIDLDMAKMGGFDKPILHGLCSFGYAARAIIRHFCDNDATKFKSIRARFAKHVFPGETIVTEMWKVSPTKIIFRCKAAERGEYVLNNAIATLFGDDGAPPAAATAAAAPKAAAAPASAPTGGLKAEAVFAQMKGAVTADVVKKVGATYRFDVAGNDGKVKSWLVDLKNGNGGVSDANAETKAECIFALKDDDFVKLMNGELNAQQAFMKGQLKIKGNMMLAQKLSALMDALKSAKPASAPAAAAAAPAKPAPKAAAPAAPSAGGSLKAEAFFAELKSKVNADLVSKVKASFRFDVSEGAVKKSWLVDLKNGAGEIKEANETAAADCAIVVKDDDFVKLMAGKLNAQQAFMQGKIKIKGNMMLAQKLSLLVSQQSAL